MSAYENIFAGFLVLIMALYAYKSKATTGPAAVMGFFIALFIYSGGQWAGLFLLFVFFVSGTFVSKWKWDRKTSLGLRQENSGSRKVANILGNGLVPACFGLLAFFIPRQADIFTLMLAGSIAAATSDTFSSEMGNVYGKKFYDILSFQPGTRGDDGVVSLAGSLWGMAGALLIAIIFFLLNTIETGIIVFLSGISGNVADSVLGASLQRRGLLNNHQVNFFATLTGAIVAGGFFYILKRS